MNGWELIYCLNENCPRKDCRRYYSKMPKSEIESGRIETHKFKDENCKYYIKR